MGQNLGFFNDTNIHWYIVGIFPQTRTIEGFDPLHPNCARGVHAVFNWLRDECYDQQIPFQDEEWTLQSWRPSCRLQKDGFNCGIYMLQIAHLIAQGAPLNVFDNAKFWTNAQKNLFKLLYTDVIPEDVQKKATVAKFQKAYEALKGEIPFKELYGIRYGKLNS